MDVESAKRRHHSLLFLQHLPTSDCSNCTPHGTGDEEPVLLSGIQQGSGMATAESYFILQKNERVGRDWDLCKDIMLSS